LKKEKKIIFIEKNFFKQKNTTFATSNHWRLLSACGLEKRAIMAQRHIG